MTNNICDKNLCTGCSACSQACPKNAINMNTNEEGFLYPEIDNNLCTDCKLCKKTCPINNYNFNNKYPKAYAIMAIDEVRKVSSSGGAFSVFAEYILNEGGVVCGAAFDENMVVKHQIIDKKENLQSLRGSKYVQSNLEDSYKSIKNYLDTNKKVFFVGTPCQVAGLKNFLNKNYNNLLTADLICHGVPSPLVLKKYIEEEFNGEKVLNINFRDKKDGWGGAYVTTTSTTTGIYSKKDYEDTYLTAFFANISLRESCYNCQYTKLPRVGDITLADCWGASSDIDDKKGTSTLFINNQNGENVFEKIKTNFKLVKNIPYENQVKIQPHLRMPASQHPSRKEFMEDLNRMSLKENLEKNLCTDKNIALLNYHWENVNFGALLTAFALNRFLNIKGYNAQNINYIPHFPWIKEEEPNEFFDEFRRKYLPMTKEYLNIENLKELNESFKHFIVGSDQVWRYEFIKDDLKAFFFDFALNDKNLISCAASFGTENIEQECKENNEVFKSYLQTFNSISIREESGIEYCKKNNINATCIIDPVFFITKDEWINIINSNNTEKTPNDAVFYTIDETFEPEIVNSINQNKTKLGIESIKNITFNTSVENWLYQIKNCKYFITDSFHGICFAIIFNKQFICVNKNLKTSTRMLHLLNTLNIKNRLYSSFEDVDIESILKEPINYEYVNKKLGELSKKSSDWLLNAIENPTKNSNKQQIRETILKLQYKTAKNKLLKSWIKYIEYKIKVKVFKSKRQKTLLKYENKRNTYKKYKSIIKEFKKVQGK